MSKLPEPTPPTETQPSVLENVRHQDLSGGQLEMGHVELALRKRIHFLEKHNQYFFRCESAWCNPGDCPHGSPSTDFCSICKVAAPTERVETSPMDAVTDNALFLKSMREVLGRKMTVAECYIAYALRDGKYVNMADVPDLPKAAVAPSPAGESQEDGLRVHIKRRDHQAAKAYVEGHNAGLESAAHVLEGGHFMSDGSLEFKWAKQVASLIRARKTTEVQP